MHVTWRERLNNDPSLRNLKNWPFVDPQELPAKHRTSFVRNRRLVAEVLSGKLIKSAAATHQVTPGYVSQLLRRCLAGEDVSPPALTRALIPYNRLTEHCRRAPLDSLHQSYGHQNAFRALLVQVPGLSAGLDKMLLMRLKDKPNAQVESPAAFFGEFKRLLRDAQWPTDVYPYTTKSMAYDAVRRYFHRRWRTLQQAEMRSPARVIASLTPVYRALKSVQIDSQTTDLNSTIHVSLHDEIEPVRVSRVTLLRMVCIASKATLAYHIALNDAPNQDDVLQLIDNFRTRWSRLTLTTPGLQYVPGSGFPSMWGNQFDYLTVDEVHLDNALVHLANTVRSVFCDQMGATFNLGLPKVPLSRNFIEDSFRQANLTTHRFASTSGSHPHDPIRESKHNQKRPPTVTLRAFEEILSVQIAGDNTVPRPELNQETSLDFIRRQASQHYLRWLPEAYNNQRSPFEGEIICNVILLPNEKRRPFIRFAYRRYKGECLHSPEILEKKKIIIKYDRRAIRKVDAYTLDRVFIGVLSAPKSWQRFEHGLQTAKAIHRSVKTWRYHRPDPLAEYFHIQAENRHNPSNALELIRLVREHNRFTLDQSSTDQPSHSNERVLNNKEVDNAYRKPSKHKNPVKKWHSSFAQNQPGDR